MTAKTAKPGWLHDDLQAAAWRALENSFLSQSDALQGDQRAAAVQQLLEARQIYSQVDGQPDMRRRAILIAINAVMRLLDCLDETRLLIGRDPLDDLFQALVDLDRGVPSPLFKPIRTGGRRPDSSKRIKIKGYAAAAVTLLMCVGYGREKAATLVADRLCKAGVALEGERPWKTVAAWRDKARRTTKVPARVGRDLPLQKRLAVLADNDFGESYRKVVKLFADDPLKRDSERFCKLVLSLLSALAGAPPPDFYYRLIGAVNAHMSSK
jgi:hypothetical protein